MPLDPRELDHRVKQLRRDLKGFSNNPAAGEVHDLRKHTRRIESVLAAMNLDSAGNETALLSGLKVVRKRAGKVRDMDVLTTHLMDLDFKGDHDCTLRLVHHLGTERACYAAKLHSTVKRHAPELRSRLQKSRRKLHKTVSEFLQSRSDLNSAGREEAGPLHALGVALSLSKELAGVSHLGRENLHAYRIEVKRLRYVLEMADGEAHSQRDLIDDLNRVQDAIGEWHDWVELTDIARKVLRHNRNCALLKKLRDTAERKFGEALKITEEMRRRYLASGRPAGRGKSKPAKMTGPVLLAASEIAA